VECSERGNQAGASRLSAPRAAGSTSSTRAVDIGWETRWAWQSGAPQWGTQGRSRAGSRSLRDCTFAGNSDVERSTTCETVSAMLEDA
jgi:hypothetical protein